MATIDWMSQAQYARARGVSREAVRKAIQAGRIVLVNGKIDPAMADSQWDRNTRKAIGRGGVPATGEAPATGALDDQDGHRKGYEAARAKREFHEARLAEMKDRERSGELVEVARVTMAVADIMRVIVDGLERIPDRVAPQINAGMSQAEIHAMVENEARSIREDFRIAIESLRFGREGAEAKTSGA